MTAPHEVRTPPRISLSLPVYNGEPFLEQAIRSILEQDFTDFELVITDNASSDRTEEICRALAYRDDRIRYIRNSRNLGCAANFNLGFNSTRGEYFKWCAADDMISKNYLSECVRALDANPNAAVAYGKLVEINEQGEETSVVEPVIPALQTLPAAERLRALLPDNISVGGLLGLYRRSKLAMTTLHQPYFSSDCVLFSEIVLLGEVLHLPQATLFNREHPSRSVNLSTSERLLFQNPSAKGGNSFELSRRIAHLYSVAYRHRGVAPLHRTWLYITLWAIRPLHLGRVALEAIGAVSPSARKHLRSFGLRLLSVLDPPRNQPGVIPASKMDLKQRG